MASRSASAAFARIEVRVPSGPEAERVAAEAYEAGAVGLEETQGDELVTLALYAPTAAAESVRRAAAAVVGADAVGAWVAVADADWSEAWKAGLEPMRISPRLVVRPSFVAFQISAGQAELVVDPGRAFGTGAHESTRLALEWIDAVAPSLAPGARVLDVGSGTGVLALAALRLADDARALACDLDPVAAQATRANAQANGLDERISVFAGSLEALGSSGFDLVLANLLSSELLPLLGALAAHTRAGGRAIFSGLLASESQAVERGLRDAGLRPAGVRDRCDVRGERWRAWLTLG